MIKYKCENHKIDLICGGCVKSWMERHDRMLEFIEKVESDNDGCVSPAFKKEAAILLKEIGKLPKNKD